MNTKYFNSNSPIGNIPNEKDTKKQEYFHASANIEYDVEKKKEALLKNQETPQSNAFYADWQI